MKLFTDSLTDDSDSYEPMRLLTFAAVAVGICLEVYSVITGKTFDMQSYGIGLGTLVGILGGVVRLNQKPAGTVTAQTTTLTKTETTP